MAAGPAPPASALAFVASPAFAASTFPSAPSASSSVAPAPKAKAAAKAKAETKRKAKPPGQPRTQHGLGIINRIARLKEVKVNSYNHVSFRRAFEAAELEVTLDPKAAKAPLAALKNAMFKRGFSLWDPVHTEITSAHVNPTWLPSSQTRDVRMTCGDVERMKSMDMC